MATDLRISRSIQRENEMCYISQRRFKVICLFLIAFGGLLLGFCCTWEKPKEAYFPKLDNYADLYLRGTYDVLHMIRVRELEKIGQACKIAAQCKLNGGKIVSRIGTPHIMYAGACEEDVPGNPNIAYEPNSRNPDYDKIPDLGEGDFLIIAGPRFPEARENGCFVLGVGYPMSTNRYSPPGFNDHPDIPMESLVDMMIYTWGPKEDGIVTPALTPHLKICPTSPMTVVAYWLIMAQIAHNLAYEDTSGTFDAAEVYIDTLMNRLNLFYEQYISEMDMIGEMIADRVLSGGKIYPWSSRWEFYQEASGTAGSVMGIYPIHPNGFYTGPGPHHPPEFNPDDLTTKDVVLLAMAGSTPDIEIEMARKIREKGVFMVGIYPFEREDGFSTAPLGELCDVSLGNLSGDMDGVLNISGYPRKIIPTVAMMNNFAFWSIIGVYIQNMEKRGEAPYYWMSWHVPGGKAYTDSVHVHFLRRGY